MPRPLKRGLARSNFAGERTIEKLLGGHDWPFLEGPLLDEDQLREVWEEMGDSLLADFIAEKPGCRPWAWWVFDATEPRRRTGDAPDPIGDELWFGKPRLTRGVPPKDAYESERAYLDRLGLLTDEERRCNDSRPGDTV
jgi:hypothetical protein